MPKSHEVWLAANGPGPWPCTFCEQPVARLGGYGAPGELHAMRSSHGIVHHHDENHGNNDPGNLRISHHGCHIRYHGKKVNWPRNRAADWIRQRISAGEYGPKLPTHPRMCAGMGIAPRTLDRALKILIDEGLIFSVPGLGTFVK